jgi:cytoskeletal protein CcmA (bactofilin family)
MARKFLTPIDLNQLELQNAVMQNLATDPGSPVQGQFYYNTTSDLVKIYDGSAWVEIPLTTESVQDIVSGVIVAGGGISSTYNDGANTLTIANTGVTSLTGTADEVTVSASAGAVTLSLPATINANTTGTAASLATSRTIELTGDVTGTISFDGSASASMATTIAANSVALGTDTTGNYIATITGTANEVEVSGSGSESATVTIGLPDDVVIGNNLTVTGNLTVSGSATYINTEIVTLNDNIVLLNTNEAGSPTANAGIEVERGTSTNVSVLWNETSDTWTLSNDGTNFHGITRKHSASIGNGAATSIAVTHNLNTRDVTVDVYSNSTYDTVDLDIVRTDANTVTVTFAVAPASNAYRVVIVG